MLLCTEMGILQLKSLILQIFFFYYFIFITSGITLEKIYTGQSLSNYFSGVVALNSNQYEESYNFLKNNENLENTHSTYSRAYIKSLINSSKIKLARIRISLLSFKDHWYATYNFI